MAKLMESSKMSCESPAVSNIENPARPVDLINLPLAAIWANELDKKDGNIG